MQKKVAIFSLLLAWLCANGALLDGVQVFAWAKMFAGYAQSMPIGAALQKTFDPKKPCRICVIVTAAKDTARRQLPHAVEHSGERIVLALQSQSTPTVTPAPRREAWPVIAAATGPSRREAVPVPPPRA